MKRIN